MKRLICSHLILAFLFWNLYPDVAWALPTDYTVESGDVTFDTSEANTLIINASDRAIINFGDFSIAQNETVRFIQSFDTASVLAHVTGGTQSDVYGSLLANGELVFVNPAGIYFHDTANIQVGSLIASTLEIQNAMYLNNQLEFQKVMGSNPGSIFNDAALAAQSGGHLALLAESVTNRGVLSAELGSVVIGAGTKQTLTFDSNGLINLVIDEGLARDIENAQPAIQNQGTVSANGGKVLLSAKALSDTFDSLINMEGVVSATRVVERDGKIVFESNGTIKNAGVINTNVFDEHGYSFKTTGTIMGGAAFYDNIDGAADISGNIGSNQSDTGNLNVTGNITLTADNLTFTADSDNDGVGAFSMNSGTQIDGDSANTYNLTLKTGQNSTLYTLVNVGSLTLDRAGAASTPTYNATGNIEAETLTINTSTTLDMGSGGYTLELNNAGSTATVFTNNGTFTAGTSTVKYSATNSGGSINILTTPYSSLQLSGAETYALTGNLTGANALTGNLTVDSGATLDVVSGSNYGITLAGNLSVNSGGTFSAQNGTVTFSGSGTQTLNMGGTGAGHTLYNLVQSGAGTLQTTGNDLKVDNNFTLNAGAGTFDNATNDRAITVTGNVTMDNSRTDMGDATWTVSGNFDDQSVTTFNRNASTLVMDGSSKTLTMNSGGNNALNNVTISGSVSTSNASRIAGITSVSGTLTVPSGTLNIFSGADLQVTSTGRVTGNGTVDINQSSNLSQMDGTIDVATLRFIRAKTSIDPGQYDSASVIFRQDSTANNSVLFSNGTYIFTGNVTFETTSSGTLTILNSTNNPNFDFRGNVDFNQGGGGTLTWTKGGGTITLGNNSSDGTQTIDFLDKTVEDITVNGSGDIKQLTGGVTTDTLTVTAGTLNANGNTMTVSGLATVNGGTYQSSTATQTLNGGLTISSGTFTGSTGDVDVNGVFTLSSGTFTAPSNLYVSDDFLFSGGTFTANGGRVTLDTTTTATVNAGGAGAGSMSFYDFYIQTAGKTVEFGAGDTFNVTNTWNVTGASGNLVTLQSTSSGQTWSVNPASASVSYVNVSDSTNLGSSVINPSNSTDGGGNVSWFPAAASSSAKASTVCLFCAEAERSDDGSTLIAPSVSVQLVNPSFLSKWMESFRYFKNPPSPQSESADGLRLKNRLPKDTPSQPAPKYNR